MIRRDYQSGAVRSRWLVSALGALLPAGWRFPAPAHARVLVGFGFPLFVGPPAYYPPPVYYPPPPYYPPPDYPPPQAYYPPASVLCAGFAICAAVAIHSPSGQACYAGATVCPMERPTATGSSCYCTTAQGRVWGRAS